MEKERPEIFYITSFISERKVNRAVSWDIGTRSEILNRIGEALNPLPPLLPFLVFTTALIDVFVVSKPQPGTDALVTVSGYSRAEAQDILLKSKVIMPFVPYSKILDTESGKTKPIGGLNPQNTELARGIEKLYTFYWELLEETLSSGYDLHEQAVRFVKMHLKAGKEKKC